MLWRVTAEVAFVSSGTHSRSMEVQAGSLDELLDSEKGDDLLEDFKDADEADIRRLTIVLERV